MKHATVLLAVLLAAAGDPIPFRNSGAGTGYWVGETRTIPGVPENGTAQAKVVAWSTALGATYEEVMSRGLGEFGESSVISVTTGGGLNPPGALIGLSGFDIIPSLPEPYPLAMGLLGAGVLLG